MYVPTLLESMRPLASRGAVGGGTASFVVHTALITAAVLATMVATQTIEQGRLIVDVPLLEEQAAPHPPAAAPTLVQPPPTFSTLDIPVSIPVDIPPPSRTAFDPTSFSGVGLANGVAWGRGRDTTVTVAREPAVYAMELVEELPVREGGAEPRYPPLLRSAHITGQVVLEFVVDTAGRVEPRSLRLLRSTNPLFEQPALDAAPTWRFRPATIGGLPVRARVHFPVNFLM